MCVPLSSRVVKQGERNACDGQDESNHNILYYCNFQIPNDIFGSCYEKSYNGEGIEYWF